MVNSIIVGLFRGPPYPPHGNESRKIPNGPLYPDNEIKKLLENGKVNTVTKDCRDNLQQLGLDIDDLKVLIQEAFNTGRYKDSEWARISERAWTACDAYVLRREEWLPHANKYMTIEYYLKFSVSNNGEVILTVSCHA